MKLILFFVIGVISFAGFLVGALFMTDNLNQEGLDKVLGKGPVAEASPEDSSPPDDKDALAQALEERERTVAEKEEQIKKLMARQEMSRQDLAALRAEVQQHLTDLESRTRNLTEEELALQKEAATKIAGLKADKAGATLKARGAEEAAELLKLMPPDKQTEILEKMDQQFVDELMQVFLGDAVETPETL
jgi:flagellar motility protein MotE (MotC chaperone)